MPKTMFEKIWEAHEVSHPTPHKHGQRRWARC
jgi:hypothetical protein